MKIVNISGENLVILNDLRNFNENFSSIKIHKKALSHSLSLSLSLENFFGKPQLGAKLTVKRHPSIICIIKEQ